jgi:hypothetical protein
VNCQCANEHGQAQENAAGFGKWRRRVIIGGMCDRAVHYAAERQRQQGDGHAPDHNGASS